MEMLISMIAGISPSEGIVLDPFLGTGTTAVVAASLGRHAIGIDTNENELAGIPQIKPPFLDIAPAGIPPNIIPHSKSVKCGLMRPDSLKFPAFMGQPLYCQA